MPSSARADVGIRPYNRIGYDEDKSFSFPAFRELPVGARQQHKGNGIPSELRTERFFH